MVLRDLTMQAIDTLEACRESLGSMLTNAQIKIKETITLMEEEYLDRALDMETSTLVRFIHFLNDQKLVSNLDGFLLLAQAFLQHDETMLNQFRSNEMAVIIKAHNKKSSAVIKAHRRNLSNNEISKKNSTNQQEIVIHASPNKTQSIQGELSSAPSSPLSPTASSVSSIRNIASSSVPATKVIIPTVGSVRAVPVVGSSRLDEKANKEIVNSILQIMTEVGTKKKSTARRKEASNETANTSSKKTTSNPLIVNVNPSVKEIEIKKASKDETSTKPVTKKETNKRNHQIETTNTSTQPVQPAKRKKNTK